MKLHPGNDTGDLFYHYYKKWVASFQKSIFKAGITARDKDIHKARVVLKKIFALLNFFEILEAAGFGHIKNSNLFRKIFTEAGKLRELQVNLQLVEKYCHAPHTACPFSEYLAKEVKKCSKEFITAIIRFDENKLKSLNKTIKKFCDRMSSETVSVKAYEFLLSKALKIGFLAERSKDEAGIHKIRKELKKMKAVTSLLNQIESRKEREFLIKKLERAEALIGEWHDHVVLVDYLNQFMQKETVIEEPFKARLLDLREKVVSESSNRLTLVIPLVTEISTMVFQKPLKDK
jgi:CHAD domain-containing protein